MKYLGEVGIDVGFALPNQRGTLHLSLLEYVRIVAGHCRGSVLAHLCRRIEGSDREPAIAPVTGSDFVVGLQFVNQYAPVDLIDR